MKPSEQRWPAQQAPDDFADRVVQAGLHASHASFAELEPPVRRAPSRFGHASSHFSGRAALRWSLAAAVAVVALALYFAKIRPEAVARKDVATAQWIQAQEEVARQAREVVELQERVAKLELEGDLLRDRLRAEHLGKVPEAARQQMRAAGGVKAAAPARPATSRPACNCQPGNPLCSCL